MGDVQEWISVGEAAEMLGVSQTTVRNWAARGRISEHRTDGGHRRFSRADILKLAEQLERAPGRPSVLVVDDDPSIRFIVEEALTTAGFAVRAVGTGLEGLAELDERPPSILLVDLMMPGLDGAQVIRTVRSFAVPVPVIAFSALGERVRQRVLEIGADAFISKPFAVRELVVTCRRLLVEASPVER